MLTHDDSKLLVVHTGRQIAGQDRYGVGLINTATNAAAALAHPAVGGQPRSSSAASSASTPATSRPNDQYFVVTSGSGGDRPPINDTADRVPDRRRRRRPAAVDLAALRQRLLGRHLGERRLHRRPLLLERVADRAGPVAGSGRRRLRHRPGPGRLRPRRRGRPPRPHRRARPGTGKALEWNPGSNSFEGNKAMLVTPRGLFAGGDATTQGGYNVGRVAFYDFNSLPAPRADDTTITTPDRGPGRGRPGRSSPSTGTATRHQRRQPGPGRDRSTGTPTATCRTT